MRRPYTAMIITALSLTACAGAGFLLSACGSSQADAGGQARPSGLPSGGGQMGDPSAMITSALTKLVTNGTITSAQRDVVAAAIEKSMPASGGQGDMQPSPGATPSPGAQRPGASGTFSTALAKLVANGTITKAQQTAIIKALSSGFRGGGGPPRSQSSGGGTF